MLVNLNLSTLLEKYSYLGKVSNKELEFLERCWLDSLNVRQYNIFPGIAPAIVCDQVGVERGSYWISCNAALLDKLKPLDSSKSRSDRTYEVLYKSGLIAA